MLEGQTARLSAAALETLAIVAYKQPVSRAQVAAIRGVNVDGVMRTLQQRGYIAEVGRDPGPGQAVLSAPPRCSSSGSASTRSTDLPPLGEFVPGRRGRGARAGRVRRDEALRPRDERSRPSDDGDRGRGRPDGEPTASGCRRCWPGPGSAAGGSARS